MGNKNFLQTPIKEAYPEFYNFLHNLSNKSISLNKLFEPYRILFEPISNTPEFINFIKECQYLAIKTKASENFWLINDQTLLKLLNSVPESQYSTKIIEYYSTESYNNIQKLINNWQEIGCVNNRIPLLQSCLNIIKSGQKMEDITNTVIPALTAQITGITEDLYELVPEKEKLEAELKKVNKKNRPSNGQITTQYFWEQGEGQYALDCYYIFKSVMINKGQFQHLNETDFEKYNKFRNKILHGDKNFLLYGTEENMIRSWLELNILINLYAITIQLKN